nr:extracellular solute-binding protein [Clostridia bacterium]
MKTVRQRISLFVCAIVLFCLAFMPINSAVSVYAAPITGGEITVFSWEDYIDEGDDEAEDEELRTSILDIFEEETGIHVNYYTFATNEEMYNEIKRDPDACDLVCPSEYMIMKMKSEGLIKPYDIPENWEEYGSPYIKENIFGELGMTEDDKTYAVGYMWGTMGYLYNADKFSAEDLNHWSAIWNSEFRGKTTIKDSIRDTYIMAIAVVYEEELLEQRDKFLNEEITEQEYHDILFEIFNRADDATIEKVEEKLLALRPNLYGFEVDSGKSDILTGKIDVNFAWSGDAVYSMDEGDEAGVNLAYVVPEEGSNVWFDGWVMPKNANEELARQFIDFLCRPKIAIRNMEYIGYVSAVAGDEILDWIIDTYELLDEEGYLELSEGEKEDYFETDISYFFGEDAGTILLYTDTVGRQYSTQYPDYGVIQRCAIMDNFDDDTLVLINAMWNRIKLITLSDAAIILISVAIGVLILSGIAYKFKDKLFCKKIKK